MLIALVGPRGSGKNTVAELLGEDELGFTRLHLEHPPSLMEGSKVSSKHLEVGQKTVSEETPLPSPGLEITESERTVFKDAEDMLSYTTVRWRTQYVTTDLVNSQDFDMFTKRPWVLVTHVDAPSIIRWKRSNAKRTAAGEGTQSLEQFMTEDDLLKFGSGETKKAKLPSGETVDWPQQTDHTFATKLARLEINNTYNAIDDLRSWIRVLHVTDGERLRPSWDTFFLKIAEAAAERSNCMKRGVGCVIAKARWFVSAGYNGTPKDMTNCHEGGCPRCNGGAPGGTALDTCLCLHAEENALLGVDKERTQGATLYCNTCPCTPCAVKIVQAGITEVVYSREYALGTQTEGVFSQKGVKFRQYFQRP